MATIKEGTGNVPQQAFQQWNDPKGNKLVSINRDGTITCLGVNSGTNGGDVLTTDPAEVSAGTRGAVALKTVEYSMTASDILVGFAGVDIVWDVPYPDTDYTIVWSIHDISQNFLSLDYAVGDTHFKTGAGFIAVVELPAAVTLVQGQTDFTDVSVGEGFTFNPAVDGVYVITVVATAVTPQIPFTAAQLNVDVAYTDSAGDQYDDGVLVISDNLIPNSITRPVFALTGHPITVYTSYESFGIAGTIPAGAMIAQTTKTGSGIVSGATLARTEGTSGVPGAGSATYYGSPDGVNIFVNLLSGVMDNGSIWTDSVSGEAFTLVADAGTANGFTAGGTMTQFFSGATATLMAVPTTNLYLGPHISGVPDLPSGNVEVPGTPPSTTHAYAWYFFDQGSGTFGLFVPTVAWSDAATRLAFPYTAHIRVVQMPNNAVIPAVGSLIKVEAMAVHN